MRHLFASLMLCFPLLAHAHLISITATTPFPATVAANSTTNATYTITNITARTTLSVIDQSVFPSQSGLSISASTCGLPMAPQQSCTIQVTLSASSTAQTINTQLREWAKPSADGVFYPITVSVTQGLPTITLMPVDSSSLPALRDPVVAELNGYWLIVSGSTGNFHDFNNTFNTKIYVYNPLTMQMYTVNLSDTDLPATVLNQLASSSTNFLQDGDTLYIIGGFYTPDNTNFTTLNTITAIDVPGMINAVKNGSTALAQFVNYNTSVAQFRVTGGQLGKIGDYFYLAFGQLCEGNYCDTLQVYTNSIYKFTTDPTLSSINIIDTATHSDGDGSGWRRRDYTLAPFMLGTTSTLFALGGPFTPGDNALVWTNGISFNAGLTANDSFINQQGNQYLAPHLSMYSSRNRMSYVATFGGLSNLYWASSGLIYNNQTPYGNILDLISSDASGNTQEYVNLQPLCSNQPLASCLYMGLAAEFIPATNYFDSRYILKLDDLPQNTPTLVGYVYGGLVSSSQDIFGTNASSATNQVYAVYVTPQGSNSPTWQNVTNAYASG